MVCNRLVCFRSRIFYQTVRPACYDGASWFCDGRILYSFFKQAFQSSHHIEILGCRPFAKGAVIGYYLAPAVLLSALLWSKEPPIAFQQLLGVNLSAGGYKSEERGVDKNGLELVSDGPVKLLRVADARKFS